MKITLQTQLFPMTEQAIALEKTILTFNQASNWLSEQVFELKIWGKFSLQKSHYRLLRQKFGLSAQMAVRCLSVVCDAYKLDKKTQRNFRSLSAIPYDQRMMTFKKNNVVSLLTLEGRTNVPFVMGEYQKRLFNHKKGQCDLVKRKDGKWFFLVTVEISEEKLEKASNFLGIDLGVVNLLTDSDGIQYSGEKVEKCRQHYHKVRRSLQRKASNQKRRKNIRKTLKRISKKESRFRRDVNHTISKQIVMKAQGTKRGIKLEEIKGIRQRTRFRKGQRAKMSGWSFYQLQSFIKYKAQLLGIEIQMINPRNTSRMCSVCGYIDKKNRKKQSHFECLNCRHQDNADVNAAKNIGASVNMPEVSENSLVG